jgi:hypothetical protein
MRQGPLINSVQHGLRAQERVSSTSHFTKFLTAVGASTRRSPSSAEGYPPSAEEKGGA